MQSLPKILFLCTGNSCRSQMAEGFCRHLNGNFFEPYSAEIETHGLNPDAVIVMQEVGIDISNQESKHVHKLKDINFDYVVTVCDSAKENCPYFPAKTRLIHKGFEDPPALASNEKTEEEKLNHYRRVRDEIEEFIMSLPNFLNLKDSHNK